MTVTIITWVTAIPDCSLPPPAPASVPPPYSGGVLRLTGAASLATYQTVLQSITYIT